MVYTSRLVVIGKTGKDLFAGLVLATRSLAYRRTGVRTGKEGKKKIHVFPRKGHEGDNLTNPDVDNYAGVIGEIFQKAKNPLYAIVAFNGHMCKRCMANIRDGMKPEIAIDSTLFEFRGAPNDARVGGIVYANGGVEIGVIGINDTDRREKRIKVYTLENNSARYTCVKDTSLDREVEIPSFRSARSLAKYLTTKIVPDAENVVAGGACILRDGKFEAGIHNIPIEEIVKWAEK